MHQALGATRTSLKFKQRSVAGQALLGLVALKIVLLFVLAWNSRFVMDEFVQLGWAKYLSNGLFERIWPIKAVGYSVFYELAHLAGWNAVSILLIGRLQTALLACGTIAIVYQCGRAIGEDRQRSLLIVLVLLCFSNIMERIFRTIAEPLALFFAAAALLVVLRGSADKPFRILAAGVLSGLSFVATQKAVYFDVALGLGLVADAVLARRYPRAIIRGAWLVLGWLLPVVTYCVIFGGMNPLAVAKNLFFGPVEVATQVGAVYAGLRHYVVQTLLRNAVLYGFCFAGMGLALMRITGLDERRRIALVFTTVITLLVFTHDQPWPYVFVMALPFMALWSPVLLDCAATDKERLRLAWLALGVAITLSFGRNLYYLQFDNRDQLELVARAESLLAPDEVYFDGIGMLPNRAEPSTLWLDRFYVLKTLREGRDSEAYRILAKSPPKIILWSYRLDAVESVIAPLVRDSYVQIAPNLRIAGRRLQPGVQTRFDVPIAGTYQLFDASGRPVSGEVRINGVLRDAPFRLSTGVRTLTLQSGTTTAFLLPEGSYVGRIEPGPDNAALFADVYN